MGSVFDALGEPKRRAILELLAQGECSAGTVVEALQAQGPASQPTVSLHLKILREAGLVAVRADGNRRLYTIEPDGVATAQNWLAALTDPGQPFEQPLDALATEVARGRRGRSSPAIRQGSPRSDRSA